MSNGTIPSRPSIATVKSGSLDHLRDLSRQPSLARLRLQARAEDSTAKDERGEPARTRSDVTPKPSEADLFRQRLHQKA